MKTEEIVDLIKTGFIPPDSLEEGNQIIQVLNERIAENKPRKKAVYVGAPNIFKLEQCCQIVNDAFGKGYGCYLVGSSLERQDWRDVDIRFIFPDEEFAALFPDANERAWEQDPRWLLLTISISGWMQEQTGLPVDFQFQPQTHANSRHGGFRNAMGLRIKKDI